MLEVLRKKSANKRMVLTLPARGSFGIIARYKGLGAGTNALLPVKARVGRTCEALAVLWQHNRKSLGAEQETTYTESLRENMMDALIKNLHTLARRYCIEQHRYWCEQYAILEKNEGTRQDDGYHYTDKALLMFPRYNILHAILTELERLIPEDCESFEEAKELCILAGQTAEDDFTNVQENSLQSQAITEEREKFVAYLTSQQPDDVQEITPLFSRRVLSPSESKHLWETVQARWKTDQGYYFPLRECELSGELIGFQDAYFESEFGFDTLHTILANHHVDKVWELREYGPEYEIELSIFEPYYNGAEGYWISERNDWLMYASHESSVTVGGLWLIEEIKQHWPNWQERIWTSPFFT